MMIEINHILCPVDLSAESEETLKNAYIFANSFRSKLSVCFCASELSPAASAKMRRKLDALVKNVIDHFVANEAVEAKIEWESSFVKSETVVQGIINEAERRGADLIIMNSRHHPWLHALLCSIAENVCRSAPCTVLVIHSDDPQKENSFVKRILIAHDFSDYSELALQTAVALAREYKAELHLLHIITESVRHEPELAWSDSTVNYLYHQTNERLQKALPLETQKIPKLLTTVCRGKPYREILSYAKEHEIDLIAMGAHGADFGLSTLFGSNVDRVLRQAPCSVLVARPLKPLFNDGKKVSCENSAGKLVGEPL